MYACRLECPAGGQHLGLGDPSRDVCRGVRAVAGGSRASAAATMSMNEQEVSERRYGMYINVFKVLLKHIKGLARDMRCVSLGFP